MAKKQSNSLEKNATFLMVAALISKMIGMLYKSPLSSVLGGASYALFQYAQNVYFILLMISSFSIPQAVSKIMAEKIAFRRYRDAQKVFYGALLYAAVAGGAVSLFCVFGAGILVPQSMEGARLALRFLAPTIFLSGILGVFRGYFQAYRNMMPTSLSQIIEQIFVAVVALLMASTMIRMHGGSSSAGAEEWGAAGATLGTGAGVLSALILMALIYLLNKRVINRRLAKDTRSLDEPMGEVMGQIIKIIMPIILSAFIYNVNGFIDSYMYSGILGYKGEDPELIKTLYAEYGYYMTLINIPLTLASTAPTSMIPEVSAEYARHNLAGARQKIDRATWISMLISIPCCVGLAVLGGPITRLIFPSTNGASAVLMLLGAITIVLNGNSNISNGVLQGIGKPRIPMINAFIALVVDVIAMALLLIFTKLGIYSIVVSMIIYAVVMCFLNDRAMKQYLRYKNPWSYAYLKPLLACVPMGVVAGGVYYLLYRFLHRNFLCLIPALCLAVLTYFVVYLRISDPEEDEQLSFLPGGRKLIALASVVRGRR